MWTCRGDACVAPTAYDIGKLIRTVGVNTARFAPSIMTPTVRMGLSPSAAYIRALAVGVNQIVRMGLGLSAQLAYLSKGGRKKTLPYGWDLHMCGDILSGRRMRRPYGL